jgi:hypothetical protein
MDVHIYVNLSQGEYGFVQKQGTLNPVVKYDLSNKQRHTALHTAFPKIP